MPHFYMSFVDSGGVATAQEKFEAPDIETARRIGLRIAGQLISEALGAGEANIEFSFVLADAQRNLLASIPVRTTAAPLPEHSVRLIFENFSD